MSSPVENVYFVNGSLHGKTLPIGCGVPRVKHCWEVYERQGKSQLFYLVEAVSHDDAKELRRENV